MKPFTRNELTAVSAIFILVVLITLINLRIAIRRSRDAQRRADLGAISNALDKYNNDFGFLPPSESGKIKACKGGNFNQVIDDIRDDSEFDRSKLFGGLRACNWGEDGLRDLFDEEYEPYLKLIPEDPKEDIGISYIYISNSRTFQIYAYMEGESSEESYSSGIVARNLMCGSYVCNFGKSFGDTPLDKSIEQYEEEMAEKAKGGLR